MPSIVKPIIGAAFFLGMGAFLLLYRRPIDPARLVIAVLCVEFGCLGIVAACVQARRNRAALQLPKHACLHCGYDLRDAAATICPECGGDQRQLDEELRH